MKCPQCQQRMSDVNYEGVLIRTCEECGGEFIGPDELSHIVRTREERFPSSLAESLAGHQPQFGVAEEELERTLTCPRCNGSMMVGNYAGDSGVHIDRCESCGGVWLDHGEIEKVQVLMERWADEAPEQIRAIADDLEQARRRAAEATDNAFSGSRFSFVNALINRFLDAA